MNPGPEDCHAQTRGSVRCIWLTGLSGAGKSTLASALHARLRASGLQVSVLDGDALRRGLCKDLGFGGGDRMENVRRVAEVARLMADAGLTTIVSLISPFRADRLLARKLFEPGTFIEVFVDAPLQECERRDPKGLYARVRRGEISNFTGIDSPYEAPETPEIHLPTAEDSVADCVDRIAAVVGPLAPGRGP